MRISGNAEAYQHRYTIASLAVIAAYLGKELWPGEAEPFFAFDLNPDRTLSARAQIRVRGVADSLFALRRTACFGEFRRRLMTRDLAGAFWECFWAHTLSSYGYKIIALQESGVKGDDFDFTVSKAGQKLCVEVTALRPSGEFKETTVLNALKQKASQLPSDKPGVIVCVLPEGWMFQEGAYAALQRSCRRLFGVSRRVNAVAFTAEQIQPVIGFPKQIVIRHPIVRHHHYDPRYPSALALEFLQGDYQVVGGLPADATAEESDEAKNRMISRPFYEWVDSLLRDPT